MSYQLPTFSRKIGGVALISVMIVVAMVSSSASWLMKSQHISIKRTTRIVSQEQAILHVFGVENLVVKLLSIDKKSPDYYTTWTPHNEEGVLVGDPLDELWSRPWKINVSNLEGFDNLEALRDVTIEFCVQDANGLLDINLLHRGLVENQGKSESDIKKKIWNKQTFMETMLLNLFESSNLGPEFDPDTPTPQQLVDSLADWLDRDDAVRPEGGENSDYSDHVPPYQTAAMRMAWPEEIYQVNGFRHDTARGFIDILTARPYSLGEDSKVVHQKININTVPRQVLSILPGIYSGDEPIDTEIGGILSDIELHRSVWETSPIRQNKELCSISPGLTHFCEEGDSEDKKYSNPYTFWDKGTKHYKKYIGVISEYFAAAIKVKSGSFENEMQTMLYRNSKNGEKEVRIVQRRFGKGYYAQCQAAKSGLVRGA